MHLVVLLGPKDQVGFAYYGPFDTSDEACKVSARLNAELDMDEGWSYCAQSFCTMPFDPDK